MALLCPIGDAHNKHRGVGLVALQEDLNESRARSMSECHEMSAVFRGARMHPQADIPGACLFLYFKHRAGEEIYPLIIL